MACESAIGSENAGSIHWRATGMRRAASSKCAVPTSARSSLSSVPMASVNGEGAIVPAKDAVAEIAKRSAIEQLLVRLSRAVEEAIETREVDHAAVAA